MFSRAKMSASALAFACVGCGDPLYVPETRAPTCVESGYAARIEWAYAQSVEPMSAATSECFRSFVVAFTSSDQTARACWSAGAGACYIEDASAIVVDESHWQESDGLTRALTFFHELTHHISECATGDPCRDHHCAVFGYGGAQSLIGLAFEAPADAAQPCD